MEMLDRNGEWRTEPGGVIALETGALRMVVKESPADRYVRFLVLAQSGDGQADGRGSAPALLASGTEESVSDAKRAAERTLARMTGDGPGHPAAPRWGCSGDEGSADAHRSRLRRGGTAHRRAILGLATGGAAQ